MAGFELILTSDTINEGRIKINNAFSGTSGLWSGSTGSQSLIHNNNTGNVAGGEYSVVAGQNNVTDSDDSSIWGGVDNVISNDSGQFVQSSIVGGLRNTLENKDTTGSIDGRNNGIFVGEDNIIGGADNMYNNTIIGGDGCLILSGWGADGYNPNETPPRPSLTNTIISSFNSRMNWATNSAIIASSNSKIQQLWGTTLGGFGPVPNSASSIIGSVSCSGTGSFVTVINSYQSSMRGAGLDIFGSPPAPHAGFMAGCAFVQVNGGGAVVGYRGDPLTGIYGDPENRINNISAGGGVFGGVNHSFDEYSIGAGAVMIGGSNALLTNDIDSSAFIIGGSGNMWTASAGNYSGILGGQFNNIGGTSSQRDVIIGGYRNLIGGAFDNSVILGGTGAEVTASNEVCMGYGGAGPGSPSTANNTLRFDLTAGDGYWDGTVNVGPADYAEFFEWQDGNPSDEDRVGLFVSLSGESIYLGNDNIIGIVSATPAMAGDAASNRWNEAFQKDEFGRDLKKEYSVYYLSGQTGDSYVEVYIDDESNVYSKTPWLDDMLGKLYTGSTEDKVFTKRVSLKIPNPSYDKEQTYIPRKDRKEWSAIGLLGKLLVKTSEAITGNKVDVDVNGYAVNGSTYHVLKETKAYDGGYGIVQILLK